MKRFYIVILIAAVCLLFATPASATLWTVTNGNSSFIVDDCVNGCASNAGAGMTSWTIDDNQVMYDQWFWYRIGSQNPETPLSNLYELAAGYGGTILSPNSIFEVLYGDASTLADSHYTVDVKYSLSGGQSGSGTADIGEQITINNLSGTALDFHFFQYSDFDLNRLTLADNVQIATDLHSVTQTPVSNGVEISETTVNNTPDYAEANYYPYTLLKLGDNSPTTLDGTLFAGPGDVTWAFEWDQLIAAHGSFVISKDKIAEPIVPEPGVVSLLAAFGGALFLGAKKLRSLML